MLGVSPVARTLGDSVTILRNCLRAERGEKGYGLAGLVIPRQFPH